MAMQQQHKNILQKNHVFLVENLNLADEILKAHLVAEGLLTLNDVELLQVSCRP